MISRDCQRIRRLQRRPQALDKPSYSAKPAPMQLHAGSTSTWPATSSRPTNPPTGRAPASSIDDKVFDAAKLTGKAAYASVLGILEDWRAAQGALKKAAAECRQEPGQGPAARPHQAAGAGALALGDLLRRRQLCRPCRRDGAPHEPAAGARSRIRQGLKAWHFIKASRALADPGATVKISDVSDQGGLGGGARGSDRPAGQERLAGQGARPMSPAIPPPTISRRATAAAGRTSATPRRSRPIGPSTRPSTAPARSAPGSCRRATSATRKISVSSCG